MSDTAVQQFLSKHQLPEQYAELIAIRFAPIATMLAQRRKILGRPLLVGINGCQGSGKSTLADALVMLLENNHGLRATALSIDDFYLTRAEREQLAGKVHPLLRTRGVPGTHDIELTRNTLQALTSAGNAPAPVPRFDKAIDDRRPDSAWDSAERPQDIVILEGWCVGATPQNAGELIDPVNDLEKNEDRDGSWRHYVNECLEQDYQRLFSLFDVTMMLKAPAFDTVFRWRLEQEDKLRRMRHAEGADTSQLMTPEQIKRFIQHYQRITEHSLRYLPQRVNVLFELNEQRNIVAQSTPRKLPA